MLAEVREGKDGDGDTGDGEQRDEGGYSEDNESRRGRFDGRHSTSTRRIEYRRVRDVAVLRVDHERM